MMYAQSICVYNISNYILIPICDLLYSVLNIKSEVLKKSMYACIEYPLQPYFQT